MKQGFFITGTDTGVGKTIATVSLMRNFQLQGYTVAGMKPVAAGCEFIEGQFKNEDALLLQENASHRADYKLINPYAFEMPVSPHLANNSTLDIDVIVQAFDHLKHKTDVLLVEGAGGWLVPLNNDYDISDLVKILQLPVIMIVAIKLGCINQARLTYQAIQQTNVICAGWIAMCLEPGMLMRDENIATIKNKISAPLLAVLPYMEPIDFELMAKKIDTDRLI